ncbi:MAG: hypothetical protein GY906_29390 [bacterium]|nr:hypothetical protein [bacterium]
MLYPLVAAFLLLTVALLIVGSVGRKPAALYALKCVWLPGLVLAAYLTFGTWQDRSYSENWAAYGVLFFVLPFTLFVLLEAVLEFVLLRGQHDSHAKAARIVTAVFVVALVVLSIVGVLSA